MFIWKRLAHWPDEVVQELHPQRGGVGAGQVGAGVGEAGQVGAGVGAGWQVGARAVGVGSSFSFHGCLSCLARGEIIYRMNFYN